MTPLTPAEVERYRQHHQPDSWRPTACAADRESWPCGGARLLATLDRLRRIEEAARAVDREWFSLDFHDRLSDLRAALDPQEAER